MHVSVSSSIERLNKNARNTIQQLLHGTLARFSPNITQVSVSIVDENGPRGGVDKLCRVNVVMPGLGRVTTNAKHEKVMTAVAEAARRARRIVVSKLKRKETQRNRRRFHVDALATATVDDTGV